DHGRLPDPRCTPGAVDPNVTQANLRATICHPGYTKTVRPSASVTSRFKYEVAYPAYREPHSRKTELDDLVSLQPGGANDAANLSPSTRPPSNRLPDPAAAPPVLSTPAPGPSWSAYSVEATFLLLERTARLASCGLPAQPGPAAARQCRTRHGSRLLSRQHRLS